MHGHRQARQHTALPPSSHVGAILPSLSGEVSFEDVSFAYPTRPGRLVFKNFNLAVGAGSSVALVGESGHGKSSAIALLERFYDPLDGQVCWCSCALPRC